MVPDTAADVADRVREAAARGERLRIVGAGTWLDAGRPVVADGTVSVASLDGIVDYVPGDLTLTALAGTPLDVIARVTGAERQLLAADPFGDARGTLGATVATASAGPLAHVFGTPRDNVIGIQMVDGAGNVVRAGGRVVKNVAGFDLARLATGAWGTVGVLTEISVRLRPLPEHDVTVTVSLPNGAGLAAWLVRLRATPLAVWSLELINGPLAELLGLGRRPLALARLAGNEPVVRAQRESLESLGDVDDAPDDVWTRLRAVEPSTAAVARVSARPTRLASLCAAPFSPAAGAVGLLAHASVARGIVRFILPGESGFGLPDFPPGDDRPTLVVERLPPALWRSHGDRLAPARAPDRLSERVRRAFDPHAILNPGILG